MTDVSLADRIAVEALLAEYAFAFDQGRPDEWAATFTPDGEFRNRAGDVVRGTAELRAFAASFAATDDVTRTNQHWTTNIMLTPLDADRMSLRCYGMIVTVAEGEPRIRSITGYDDEVRRVGGRWRFSRRAVAGWPMRSGTG
jgi:hypothetical protein